jgi:hypothetical protein
LGILGPTLLYPYRIDLLFCLELIPIKGRLI